MATDNGTTLLRVLPGGASTNPAGTQPVTLYHADGTPLSLEPLSPYDVAVANGFVGTAAEWLAEIQGSPGRTGNTGLRGVQGEAGTVQVYGVTTLAPGEPAEVVNHGDASAAALEFRLPQGPVGATGRGYLDSGAFAPFKLYAADDLALVSLTDSATDAGLWRRVVAGRSLGTWALDKSNWSQWSYRGPTGDAATVAVASVTTLPAGYPATVTNLGDSHFAQLAFALPEGRALTTIDTLTIASVLNIGRNPGQNHFSLQLSQDQTPPSITNPNPTQPTSFVIFSDLDLNNGLSGGEAQVATTGDAVDLATKISAWAGTTGSSYPRAEFRELKQDGTNAAWDPAAGYHLFEGTYRILELPSDSHEQTVVIHQVHNNNNDAFVVRTQVATDVNGVRNLRLLLRLNGSSAVANTTLQTTPGVGVDYDIRTEIKDGYLRFWFAAAGTNLGDNFTASPTYQTVMPFQGAGVDVKALAYNALGYGVKNDLTSYTSGSTFVNGLPAWYFKFGQYTQTNPIVESNVDPRFPGTPAAAKLTPLGVQPVLANGSSTTSQVLAVNTIQGNPNGQFRIRFRRVRHYHVINGTPDPLPQRINPGVAIPGRTGDTGPGATIVAVSAHDLPTGAGATVTNTGTATAAILDVGVPAGRAATVGIGTVTTLAPGSAATVQNVGTSTDAILNLALPRGAVGAQGTAASVVFRNVTTGAAGSAAILTTVGYDSGTNTTTYDLQVPQGIQGIQGLRGLQGDTGVQGNQGLQGIQGVKGDTGPAGAQSLFVQDNSPGNLGYPYTWYKTTAGTITNVYLDDGKG